MTRDQPSIHQPLVNTPAASAQATKPTIAAILGHGVRCDISPPPPPFPPPLAAPFCAFGVQAGALLVLVISIFAIVICTKHAVLQALR